MCISFEKISEKRCNGNKELLEGLTKLHRDAGHNVSMIDIPVEMLEIDTRYQTEVRTERDLRYLTNGWDENKLLPLIGVPHWEEGKVYLVDGYGRWMASQIVDRDKYNYLTVMVILNAPSEKEERLKFEAEMYAYQNKQVAKVTPIQKHGAMIVLNDPATKKIEELKNKYKFEYVGGTGQRSASVLGSYPTTLALCKIDNGKAADFVFEVCVGSGFDRKTNGYSRFVMRSIKDMYRLYANDRDKVKKYLISEFRKIEPRVLRCSAVAKYPILDMESAVSLYVEDLIVEGLGLEQSREVVGTKAIPIKKAV